MPLKSIRAWLGVDALEKHECAPLGETLEALDHLEPDRARYLAAFAYLLGRVAHADQHVSPEETRAMEALVREQGRLLRVLQDSEVQRVGSTQVVKVDFRPIAPLHGKMKRFGFVRPSAPAVS